MEAFVFERSPVRHLRRWLRNWEGQWSVPGIQELSASCDPSAPVCIFVEKQGICLHFCWEERNQLFFYKWFCKSQKDFKSHISCPLSSPRWWWHGFRKRRWVRTRVLENVAHEDKQHLVTRWRIWKLLPVTLISCLVPMLGCLHTMALSWLPENRKINTWAKIIIQVCWGNNPKYEESLTTFCSEASSKAL